MIKSLSVSTTKYWMTTHQVEPGSIEISRNWHEKIQTANRSPYKKLDINQMASSLHSMLEKYLERPVGLLLCEVNGYPWFIENRGGFICYRKIKGKEQYLPHGEMTWPDKSRPCSLILHPKFLRYSDEQLLDLMDFLLFADDKSENKFRKTFTAKSAQTKQLLRMYPPPRKSYLLPDQDDIHDIVGIGRRLESEYMRHICAQYRWDNKVSLRRLGFFTTEGYAKYFVVLNPALNDPSVPKWVIEHLIFHELLHAYYCQARYWPTSDAEQKGITLPADSHHCKVFKEQDLTLAKYNPHCKVFKEAERTSPYYDAFQKWKRENFRELAVQKFKQSLLKPNSRKSLK